MFEIANEQNNERAPSKCSFNVIRLKNGGESL